MTPLFLVLFKFVAFQAERIVRKFFQEITWFFNGTRKQIQEAKNHQNYATSARLSKVKKFHIFDPVLSYNSPINLITSHVKFVPPEYVLKEEVSLYTVTDSEALFVEAPPGVEVWKSQYSSFHKIAQHEHAVNIISMPLSSFYRLADELGEIKEKMIFLDFVPRSGSTLFGQVFEETGVCVNYSEPSMLNMFMHDFDEVPHKKVLKASIRFYTKPRSKETQAFVFKYMPMGRPIAPLLQDMFPEAHFFHMTRNAISNIKSIMKTQSSSPYGRTMRACFSIPILRYKFGRASLKSMAFDLDKRIDSLALSAQEVWYGEGIPWFVTHHIYIRLQKTVSFDFPSIKYEDLVGNSRENVEMLFTRCGLSTHLVDDALTAFTKDSQAGSPFDKDILAKYNPDHLVDSDCIQYWQYFADHFGFQNWISDFRLPGTITKPSAKNQVTQEKN